MPKELFNQTLQTSIADRTNKLLAYAQPSQTGAENISIVNFCKNEIGLTGTTGNIGFLNNTTNKINFDTALTYDSANDILTFPKWKPASDSATALKFFKTNGTSEIFNLALNGSYPSWDYQGVHRFYNDAATLGAISIHNSTSVGGLVLSLSTGNVILNNTENGYLSFHTDDTERVNVSSTGVVKIIDLASSEKTMVSASSTGELDTVTIITGKLTNATAILLIDDSNNWASGVYTGTAITGTYEGQYYLNDDYFFFAYSDDIWIRIVRSV